MVTSDVTHSRHFRHSIGCHNCGRIGNSLLLARAERKFYKNTVYIVLIFSLGLTATNKSLTICATAYIDLDFQNSLCPRLEACAKLSSLKHVIKSPVGISSLIFRAIRTFALKLLISTARIRYDLAFKSHNKVLKLTPLPRIQVHALIYVAQAKVHALK